MLLMGDEEEENEEDSCEPPVSFTEELAPEVSLNSVVGLSNPKTLKLMGLIGKEAVVVMVDPGPPTTSYRCS